MTAGTPVSAALFVSIDVETTGLDPQRDAIVEIGAVKMQGTHVIDEFQTLVSIDHTIPIRARQVHGISNDMLVGMPSIREALTRFLRFVGPGVLVEHSNRAFDVAFLETAHGSRLPLPYINTCTLSRRLFPFYPRHSLAECCKRYNIENHQPHRALGDAHATARLLIKLLESCSTRYPHLEDLLTVAAVEREGERRPYHRARSYRP